MSSQVSNGEVSPGKAKHFLLIPHPLWGHTKPMLSLGFKMLTMDPDLLITAFMPTNFVEMVLLEREKWALTQTQKDRLVIHSKGEEGHPLTQLSETFAQFDRVKSITEEWYPKLLEGSRGVAPTLVIYDWPLLAVGIPPLIEQLTSKAGGKRPKFVLFTPCSAHAANWGLVDNDDVKAIKGLCDDLEKGVDVHTAWMEHMENNMALVHSPDVAPMYCYEGLGNDTMEKFFPGFHVVRQLRPKYADGYAFGTHPCLSKQSLATWPCPPMFCTGSQLPPASSPPSAGVEDPEGATVYLDEAEKTHGKGHTVLVSFGSTYFISETNILTILIKSLAKRGRPALMSEGNALPEVKEALRNLVKQHGNGLVKLVKWFDQPTLLRHPAVGWMFGHAGQGGIYEALNAGVPMVLLPSGSDQPFWANQLSQLEKCAIELVQIRNELAFIASTWISAGVAIGRPTYRGVTVKGEASAIEEEMDFAFREMDTNRGPYLDNVLRIQRDMKEDLAPDGKATQAIRDLLALGAA